MLARPAIGLRGHDQPVQLFDAPAVIDKVTRQPVQQLRMRGTGAHLAEIARRGHDPVAGEVLCPDPIGHHPRCQGVVGIGDPPRQREPAARGGVGDGVEVGGLLRVVRSEDRAQHAGRDDSGRRLDRPAAKNLDHFDRAAAFRFRRHGEQRLVGAIAVGRPVVHAESPRLVADQFALEVVDSLLVDLVEALLQLRQSEEPRVAPFCFGQFVDALDAPFGQMRGQRPFALGPQFGDLGARVVETLLRAAAAFVEAF